MTSKVSRNSSRRGEQLTQPDLEQAAARLTGGSGGAAGAFGDQGGWETSV